MPFPLLSPVEGSRGLGDRSPCLREPPPAFPVPALRAAHTGEKSLVCFSPKHFFGVLVIKTR